MVQQLVFGTKSRRCLASMLAPGACDVSVAVSFLAHQLACALPPSGTCCWLCLTWRPLIYVPLANNNAHCARPMICSCSSVSPMM
jgi:hypothetical protein